MNTLTKSIKFMIITHIMNVKVIFILGKERAYQQTLRTSLGIGWVFIRDLVYFGVFILFRYIMSGGQDIEGMNYMLYILLGIIPWNFMREVINGGVTIIKSSKPIISSIALSVTILPTVEVIAIFYKRLFTLAILIISILFFGEIFNVNWWLFIYYFCSMFILMLLWNSIFSALIAISNDFEQLYKAVASILFYTLPVIWSFENLKSHVLLIDILKLNPFVYIIDGFRGALQKGMLPSVEYTLYFWVVCLFLFLISSLLQYKLKRHYIDFI